MDTGEFFQQLMAASCGVSEDSTRLILANQVIIHHGNNSSPFTLQHKAGLLARQLTIFRRVSAFISFVLLYEYFAP